jgi:hypothetical protein
MPEIPDPHRYVPDKNALTNWLYTRKTDRLYGMNDTTGFFSTYEYPKDLAFFQMAMGLEVAGILLFIYNGLMLGDSLFAVIAIIGAVALSAGDVLFAYRLHRNHQRKCLARFKLRIIRDDGLRHVIQDEMKAGKFVDVLLTLGIILIAVVKMFGIVLLGTFDHVAIYVFLVLMFGFIVYVHLRHTGYAIYGWLTERTFKKQLALLNRGDNAFATQPDNPFRHYFESAVNLFDGAGDTQSLMANPLHHIERVPPMTNAAQAHSYQIVSKGILMDRDIAAFTQRNGLHADQITVISRECMKLQLRQYDATIYNDLVNNRAIVD